MAKKKFAKTSWKTAVKTNVEKQNKGSDYGYLSLPKGMSMYKEQAEQRCRLDIMPYIVTNPCHADRDVKSGIAVPGSLWYRAAFRIHRQIGADNEKVVCPVSFGKKCPICDLRKQKQMEGADREELKPLNTSARALYAVIPKGKGTNGKVHLWDISQSCFQNKLNEEINENEDYGCFPDLEEGYTLDIRFVEESIGKNKFFDCSRVDFREREEPYDESILDSIPKLDEIIQVLSYEELEKKFYEIEDILDDTEPEPEDDEDEKPRRRRKVVEPEPEPEPEEDDEPLVRRRRKVVEPEPEPEPKDNDEPIYTPEALEAGEDFYCKACGGTGLNSRGDKCHPCRGRGINIREWEEELEAREFGEPEPEPPTTVRRKKKAEPEEDDGPKVSRKAKATGDKCPHGHKFGKDCEQFDDCDDCELWEQCSEQ